MTEILSDNGSAADSDADRAHYDRSDFSADEASFLAHARIVEAYRQRWQPAFHARFGDRTGLTALELGAGSCLLSLACSASHQFAKIIAFDISRAKMERTLPLARKAVAGMPDKLELREGSFNQPLPFPDASMDVVMFDAALHHSRNVWFTLAECHRVLRSDGLLVAQREQFLAPLTATFALRRLAESPEVRAGVSENAYLRSQYEFYLRAAGFDVRFIPVYPDLRWSVLRMLNGVAFAKYNIIATKRAS